MHRHAIPALLVAVVLLAVGPLAFADDAPPPWPAADDVLDRLKRTLDWYQQARHATQTAREAAVIVAAREDEQSLLRVVQRAFEAARAQAALVDRAESAGAASPETSAASPAPSPAARRAERRAKLEAAIRDGTREVERLRARARTAPPARRATLEREATAAANRLALDRLRLELLTSLQQTDASLTPGDPDLVQQIQALQELVPEVAGPPAAAAAPAAKPATAQAAATPQRATGTWGAMNRLLSLQRARSNLALLAATTHALSGEVETEAQRTREAVRELSRRLRAMAGSPGTAAPASLDEGTFRRELDRLKLLGATLVPLRAESALLQRFDGEIRTWQRAVDRESRRTVQELALGLAGVVIGLAAIAAGALAWRIAANRYVKDPYRRRLLLRTRSIVVGIAVVLLVVFHFTSELTALVTALGFAAAGIAFALQTVIVAVAGYFSMMAPNGIRVGDRVSLQGPFGYVHGEVVEIGLVRLRLRELTADGLEPTGRIVVFPNSVVFTGSFFKHPPPQAKAA